MQKKEFFTIASVSRDDINTIEYGAHEHLDSNSFTDEEMERLASKMAEAYTESVFWIDLEIIARQIINDRNTN